MMDFVRLLGAGILAYLIGSISFAMILTRWVSGIDVRTQGSGHAGATNTMRASGWPAGIAVLLLDIFKGYAAVWLAVRIMPWEWVAVVAATFVVAGHCWPVFAGFRGGMGMSSLGGAMLAVWPLGFALALGVVALTQLTVRHSARANVVAGIVMGPVWAALGASPVGIAVGTIPSLLVAYRSLSDWNRAYSELWLDRDAAGRPKAEEPLE